MSTISFVISTLGKRKYPCSSASGWSGSYTILNSLLSSTIDVTNTPLLVLPNRF